MSYRNTSDKKIVAIQFGLLAFNIFNEFQDRLGGFTIEDVGIGESESGAWVASALAEAAFLHGCGVRGQGRIRGRGDLVC